MALPTPSPAPSSPEGTPTLSAEELERQAELAELEANMVAAETSVAASNETEAKELDRLIAQLKLDEGIVKRREKPRYEAALKRALDSSFKYRIDVAKKLPDVNDDMEADAADAILLWFSKNLANVPDSQRDALVDAVEHVSIRVFTYRIEMVENIKAINGSNHAQIIEDLSAISKRAQSVPRELKGRAVTAFDNLMRVWTKERAAAGNPLMTIPEEKRTVIYRLLLNTPDALNELPRNNKEREDKKK